MLVVETLARIRREFFVKGKSIKEIVRDLGVSRNTVRKVLRSGETAFAYERSVQPLPKLGPWAADLERLLEANERKARREKLTMIRVFEELQGLGYRGGYDAVRRYAAGWHRDRSMATSAAYVPLSFAPGEAYQFDWSHEMVLIGGVTTTVKVAHLRLCHSRMFYVRAYRAWIQGDVAIVLIHNAESYCLAASSPPAELPDCDALRRVVIDAWLKLRTLYLRTYEGLGQVSGMADQRELLNAAFGLARVTSCLPTAVDGAYLPIHYDTSL